MSCIWVQRVGLFGLSLVLAGCAGLPEPNTSAPPAVVTQPEPVVCPELEPCVCPEPERIVVPAPVPVQCPAKPVQLPILGGIEWVQVDSSGIKAQARIDTGAKSSSINARQVVEFERDGERWVRFEFDARQGQPAVPMEKAVERRVRIKQHGELESQRRYVVKLPLAIGDLYAIVDVTLNDRSEFEYPVLIGRNFLTDNAMVDVAKQFLAH